MKRVTTVLVALATLGGCPVEGPPVPTDRATSPTPRRTPPPNPTATPFQWVYIRTIAPASRTIKAGERASLVKFSLFASDPIQIRRATYQVVALPPGAILVGGIVQVYFGSAGGDVHPIAQIPVAYGTYADLPLQWFPVMERGVGYRIEVIGIPASSAVGSTIKVDFGVTEIARRATGEILNSLSQPAEGETLTIVAQ